ncbi:BAZ1B [Mytilus edulis]|uniref:BAZ1B n=1 Tax=Mytilus edulis TaxID=6550 RepID=A0A8S3T3I3_MYTED|nr:BAZ1B [Mytilus edulis]
MPSISYISRLRVQSSIKRSVSKLKGMLREPMANLSILETRLNLCIIGDDSERTLPKYILHSANTSHHATLNRYCLTLFQHSEIRKNVSEIDHRTRKTFFAYTAAHFREYEKRLSWYKQPIWTCRCTAHVNLTHQAAWESEKAIKKSLKDTFPKVHEKSVLELVHHSTAVLDTLVDQGWLKVQQVLSIDEKVSLKVKISGKVVKIDKAGVEMAEVAKRAEEEMSKKRKSSSHGGSASKKAKIDKISKKNSAKKDNKKQLKLTGSPLKKKPSSKKISDAVVVTDSSSEDDTPLSQRSLSPKKKKSPSKKVKSDKIVVDSDSDDEPSSKEKSPKKKAQKKIPNGDISSDSDEESVPLAKIKSKPEEIIQLLESQELYDLDGEQKVKILKGLCLRIMGTYSVQDYMEEKQNEATQLWKKKMAELKKKNDKLRKEKDKDRRRGRGRRGFSEGIQEEEETEVAGVVNWREAVKSCTTMSRLHVLIGMLDSCIKWEKSAENVDEEGDIKDEKNCIECGGDEGLIFCSECPSAYHLDCHHPPLRREPRGSWSSAPKRKNYKEWSTENSDEESEEEAPKSGRRGRASKQNKDSSDSEDEAPSKGRRGRAARRKQDSSDSEEEAPSKSRRGRPARRKQEDSEESEEESEEPRASGRRGRNSRKRKDDSDESEAETKSSSRRSDRSRKTYKEDSESDSESEETSSRKRKRGRPSKGKTEDSDTEEDQPPSKAARKSRQQSSSRSKKGQTSAKSSPVIEEKKATSRRAPSDLSEGSEILECMREVEAYFRGQVEKYLPQVLYYRKTLSNGH